MDDAYENGRESNDGRRDSMSAGSDDITLRSLTVTQSTPTSIVGDFRSLGQPGYVVQLTGTGLGGNIAAGQLTGTLTGIRKTFNGRVILDRTGLSIPAQALLNSSSFEYGGLNDEADLDDGRTYRSLTITASTPTSIVGDYRSLGQPGYVVQITGTGLGGSLASGQLTGTVTGLRETLNGTVLYETTGLSVPAQNLLTAGHLDDIGGRDDRRLGGSDGDDVLWAGQGRSMMVGGAGTDTAVLGMARMQSGGYRYGDQAVVFGADPRQADRLSGVELLRYTDQTTPVSSLAAARPYQYLASYDDLSSAFGADGDRGWEHFAETGIAEGRSAAFSGLAYTASYADLRAAFGTDAESAARQYIQGGRAEGRTVTFDGNGYLAANADLRAAYGTDADRATEHYISRGAAEGRVSDFDGLRYIASYGDLISAVPKTDAAGTMHFLAAGATEGRAVTFDALRYIASSPDLVAAFGTNEARGLDHWLNAGYTEGRSATGFDPTQYLAKYADLSAAFGTDTRAATRHWIETGEAEGRVGLF